MAHLKQHDRQQAITHYSCTDCKNSPSFTYRAFKEHLGKYHTDESEVPLTEDASNLNVVSNEPVLDYNDNQGEILKPPPPTPSKLMLINKVLSDEFSSSINQALFVGVLELKADPILSDAQLNRSLTIFSGIYKTIVEKYHQVFDLLISGLSANDEEEDEKKKVLGKLNRLTSVFDDYSSIYKQLRTYESMQEFVKSETVFLGEREDTRRVRGKAQIIKRKETFEFISITETIKNLLKSDKIVNTLKEFKIGAENEGEIEPVYYYKHPFWSNSNTLRLVLFHDEIEPKNALSEIRTLYKIDMFYFSIINLTRKHSSNLKNIFLVAAIYSEDEKKYKINSVTSKIVKDLALLEQGIEINGETYYGSVAQTAGDNLG
jgi:hypothetical protein